MFVISWGYIGNNSSDENETELDNRCCYLVLKGSVLASIANETSKKQGRECLDEVHIIDIYNDTNTNEIIEGEELPSHIFFASLYRIVFHSFLIPLPLLPKINLYLYDQVIGYKSHLNDKTYVVMALIESGKSYVSQDTQQALKYLKEALKVPPFLRAIYPICFHF